MSLWRIRKQNGVSLTYVKNGVAKDCGASDAALLPDLLAWVCDVAEVADRIVVEDEGVFVRMPPPPTTHGGM